jgi:type II secretory pathway pseudopilin PulG
MRSARRSPSIWFLAGIESGITMIEIMVVISLIAFLYVIAVPQLSLRTGTEAATKVQRVADDIRSAFDMAVLNNRTYRLSFVLSTGEYWLEEADREVTDLVDSKSGRDPTVDDLKARSDEFDAQTKEFESLLGDPIKDEDGKDIPGANTSPILKNRVAAKGPKWTRVEALEWQNRSLGPYLLISEMQAEHHQQKQVLGDLGEAGRAFIYFFPAGYVEKSYVKIAFKRDTMVVDEEQKPYTIITRPFLGTAEVISGAAEIDVHDLKEESGQSG